MSGRGEWSLAGRLTRLFLLSTSIFVVVLSAAGVWFLDRSTERELAALLREELDEVDAKFQHTDQTPEHFAEISAELAAHHPANPLAWQVWRDEEPWGTFGSTDLLAAGVPDGQTTDRVVEAPGGRRWMVERLSTGHVVGLVLDGSAQLGLVRRYWVFAGVALLASLALALIVGRLFFQRVSRVLSEVARRARDVRSPDSGVQVDVAGAPREIREIAEALDQMLDNIRTETARAQLFTAGLAHELRSPVQNLIGETEVALLASPDADGYRQVLHSHIDELHELADAIDNLIAICSARETRKDTAREDFDLGEEADIRLRRESAVADRGGVRLSVRAAGDLRLFGDRETILRAVRNLIANAIEWSPEGGEVDVELRGGRDEVVITVDDSGPGVPDELGEHIFEPFFQGPERKLRNSDGRRAGYGLGLGMVRSAVENQGGSVEVGTSPAGGARFRLVLPREGRSEMAEPRRTAASTPR